MPQGHGTDLIQDPHMLNVKAAGAIKRKKGLRARHPNSDEVVPATTGSSADKVGPFALYLWSATSRKSPLRPSPAASCTPQHTVTRLGPGHLPTGSRSPQSGTWRSVRPPSHGWLLPLLERADN